MVVGILGVSIAAIGYGLIDTLLGFVFSSRRRHTRCALVTGVQTCALPISSRREAAVQTSPWLKNTPQAAASTAASRCGQSANTICGALPPSSRLTRFRLLSPA